MGSVARREINGESSVADPTTPGATIEVAITTNLLPFTLRNERATTIDDCFHSCCYFDYMRNSRDTSLWRTTVDKGNGCL